MLLMNKTLIKLARGLWGWILAIAAVSFLTLIGTTALAEIVGGFLGDLFDLETILGNEWSAVSAALLVSVFTFAAQLVKGLLEYKTAAKARGSMRAQIFSKVLELDAGGIEKIGPVSAITASVDAVEQMQGYFSTYLPSLIISVVSPVYLFFHLKDISTPIAVLLLIVSLVLLPLNNVFRKKIEQLRKGYWRSLDDMTGYYMDSLRGLTTLKLFDRDQEHSRVLGEKAGRTAAFTKVRQDIGVVLDEACLPDELTAQQVGKVMHGIYANWDDAAFSSLCARLDLPKGKKVKDFSRGTKMKLAIAAALSHKAKLLVLDEATGGLDPVVRDEILDLLNDFTREEEHAILLSSHIVTDLEKICDYVVFLHKGRVQMAGEKDELLERYALLNMTHEDYAAMEKRGVARMLEGHGGVRVLMERQAAPRGAQTERLGLEDMMLLLEKGEKA